MLPGQTTAVDASRQRVTEWPGRGRPTSENVSGPWKPQWAERQHPGAQRPWSEEPVPSAWPCRRGAEGTKGGSGRGWGSLLGLAKAGRDSAWDWSSHGSAGGLSWLHQTLLPVLWAPWGQASNNPPVLPARGERHCRCCVRCTNPCRADECPPRAWLGGTRWAELTVGIGGLEPRRSSRRRW